MPLGGLKGIFLVLSWWTHLLCIVRELARGGCVAVAVSVGDRGKVTCDMWQVTCDTRHVTCDMWHVTSDMWHVISDMWHIFFFFLWHLKLLLNSDGLTIIWDNWEVSNSIGQFIILARAHARIHVEPFLKMAAERLCLSVVAILKPLE